MITGNARKGPPSAIAGHAADCRTVAPSCSALLSSVTRFRVALGAFGACRALNAEGEPILPVGKCSVCLQCHSLIP